MYISSSREGLYGRVRRRRYIRDSRYRSYQVYCTEAEGHCIVNHALKCSFEPLRRSGEGGRARTSVAYRGSDPTGRRFVAESFPTRAGPFHPPPPPGVYGQEMWQKSEARILFHTCNPPIWPRAVKKTVSREYYLFLHLGISGPDTVL